MDIQNFWKEADLPIVALSPMDGVTDAVFRRIVAQHGKPDLIVTEFTSVEGILHGAESELAGLVYDEMERPVVAQIYGADPSAFFHVAQLICALGFDGVDINMGCPAKAISSRGCGAGLIQNPLRAKEILRAAREGIERWAEGAPLSLLTIRPQLAEWLSKTRGDSTPTPSGRRSIPISVKTRLGTDRIVIEEWIRHLLDERPAAVSIHGRTLAQRYSGSANWGAIAKAAEAARGSGTLILGNGDIASLNDARRRIRESGVDGVLIGRAALGNPWIFRNKEAFRRELKTEE
ncbi:MAG TPA: tRNA-dihydrouridine synthase family protein, partial [Candidatus Manganitrophaceae bacterium]